MRELGRRLWLGSEDCLGESISRPVILNFADPASEESMLNWHDSKANLANYHLKLECTSGLARFSLLCSILNLLLIDTTG